MISASGIPLPRDFLVSKAITITLSTASPSQISRQLAAQKIQLSSEAKRMMFKNTQLKRTSLTPFKVVRNFFSSQTQNQPTQIQAVIACPADLGLTDFATYQEILTAARKLRLDICPAEVGPSFSLQHISKLDEQEEVALAMQPIPINGQPHLYLFENLITGQWLYHRQFQTDSVWRVDTEFLFRVM